MRTRSSRLKMESPRVESPRDRAKAYWEQVRRAELGAFTLPAGELHEFRAHLDGLDERLARARERASAAGEGGL